MKNYFSGYGHSLRLFPLNDDRENMVRCFREYVKIRPGSHDELLREQFNRIGQRLWAAIKTLPLQDEEIEEFEFMDDQDMGISKDSWLRWQGKSPRF